jgi:hypothetical protein
LYTNLSVENFRAIRQLEIGRLGRVTLLFGRNGAGKTTVLEALFLLGSPGHPSNALRLNAFRGLTTLQIEATREVEAGWASLFPFYETERAIRVSGSWADMGTTTRQTVTVRNVVGSSIAQESNGAVGPRSASTETGLAELEMTVDGFGDLNGNYRFSLGPRGARETPDAKALPFRALMMHSRIDEGLEVIADRFSELVARGRESEILEAVRIVEPDVRGLRLLSVGGVPVVHADIGGAHQIPLPLMGGGLWRLFIITVNILWCGKGGLLLVDEFEYGVHYSVLPRMWQLVDRLADQYHVQVVATTHSRECIEAGFRSQEAKLVKDAAAIAFMRIGRDKSGVSSATLYDASTLEAALEGDVEVR